MQSDHDPFDTGVESTQDKLEELRKKNLRAQYIDDLRITMQTRPGRRLLHTMLKQARVFGGGFVENERAMYFKEGARNSGLRLLNDMMEADNSAYIQMLTEED